MEYQLGLQMYSVKHVAEDDLVHTLKKIREIGYQSIELIGYYTYKPSMLRRMLKRLDLKVPSVHVPLRIYDEKMIEKDFGRSAKFVSETGASYIVVPWLPIREDIKEHEVIFFQQLLERLVKIAEEQKLQLVLHNFTREFVEISKEQYIMDQIIEKLSEDQLKLELDFSKIFLSGLDPREIYHRYESRTPFLHIRTMTEGRKDCLLEDGVIDYKKLLPSLKNLDSKVMYIEQQVHKNKALEDAEKNFQYLSQLLETSKQQSSMQPSMQQSSGLYTQSYNSNTPSYR